MPDLPWRLEDLVLRPFVLTVALVAIVSAVAAQEADYSEYRVAPSRVPPLFLKTAEKEAPGIRFSVVYIDNEKGYRFVGKAADRKTYSVRIDRQGAVEWRHVYTDVPPAKFPKPVAETIRNEIAKNKELAGFQPARTSLVERFNARKNEVETYYEVFGQTPEKRHPRIEVDPSGKLRLVSTSFIPSPEGYGKYEALSARRIPPEILEGITTAAPGIKIARVYRVTNTINSEVRFEAYGRVDRGRGVEVTTDENGHAFIVAVSVPLREIPQAVRDAIVRQARTDEKLVNFRPTEARIRHLLDIGRERYQFFGDGPDGEPLDVTVDHLGNVLTMRDLGEVIREEAGITSPEARPKGAIATKGFAVLAGRYGVDHLWMDITEALRAAAVGGRKEFTIEGLPDPAYGRHKTIVMLYAMDGKVGLAEVRDDQALPLDASRDASTLASIPARGFAVLAARYGIEDKWHDVTAAVSSRVADGRLDFVPVEAGLSDPAPGQPKALAVAYASSGKVGLYVQAQWRSPNLPPDAAPVNSDSLLAKSIEFPQKPSLVAFTSDSRNVVVGVEDGSIRMLDAASGRETRRLDGDKPGWHPVAISGDGALMVSGGTDGVMRIWDVKAEREKAVLRGHTDKVQRVTFSPTRRYVASTAWDKTVRLWDVNGGREVRKFEGHTEFVDGVKFTPDGRQLVTASWDRTVRIWDVATGREVRKIQTTGNALSDVGISKTGRDILFGSKDGTLRWWQPASNREPVSFKTYAECEWACAPLPDGHRVLVSDLIVAALWDCKTSHPVLRLEKHIGRVTGLAVSPDGKRAATCSDDKTLKIWNLPDLGR
jgi:hypothetical protein